MSPKKPSTPAFTWKNGRSSYAQVRLVVTERRERNLVMRHLWMVTAEGKSLLDPRIKESVVLDSGFAKSQREAQRNAESAALAIASALEEK